MRTIAFIVLAVVFVTSIAAGLISPASYEVQFRELPNSPPTSQHILGTDDLGRDRLSRLLYGTRISLILAPAAAFLATILAALMGASAAMLGGWWERAFLSAADLSLSLPWIFLLITVRALLPLDVAPWLSVAITFMLLG